MISGRARPVDRGVVFRECEDGSVEVEDAFGGVVKHTPEHFALLYEQVLVVAGV